MKAFDDTDIGYDFENKYIILAKKDSENNALEILSAKATQQTGKTITGKVVEVANGEPVIGATVIVKGDATKGTVTDVDGNYVLMNVPENATLVFSFVGMKTEEVIIGDQTRIDIRMEYESIGLEELVAIGYGTVRKVDLSGSVSSVAGEALSIKKSSVSILDALQGTMPGVTVTRNSGEPGGAGSIRVRGITTIGDSNPLIIVDGVPGSISGLNATDIESISVLKDAASASIYGAKAAAGVIIISTKRGKSGKVELQYDLQYGFDQPTRVPKTLSAVPFMTMLNELIWNDNNNSGTEYPKYSKDLIDNYVSLNAENPDQYPDTDWTQYLNNFSPRQSHSLSFSAGQERFTTRGSINFDRVESIIEDRPYINFTARTNNDFYFSKILSAHFDIQYTHSHDQRKQAVPSPALFSQLEPLERAYWTDGRVANFRNAENHFARLLSGGSNNQWNNNIGGRLALELVPVKGLKISGIFAPAISFYKAKNHYLALPMTNWDNPDLIVGHVGGVKFTRLGESRNDNNNYTLQYLTTYTNSFGDHNLDLLAGYEYYYTFSEQLGASRDQYILDNYPYLNLGPLDFRDNSGSAWEYASRSFFGRLMYNFKNKYLFQSNVRYDGSSRFHKDYRYGLFPSASFGWVMTEEPFMEDIDVLSFLKMRVSYGTLGNERIGNYPYQSTIAFSYALLYEGTDVSTSQTAYSPRYVIPDISWETTKTFDIGLDINFLNDRLQVVADYYNKKTTDMLLALEIPNYIGLSNPNQNTGSMKTKGWELGIRYNNNIGDLNYAISGNLSDFKSTMGYLGGTEFLGDQVKFEGSEFNEWYGYKADGIYQTEEEVSSSATINNRVRPGDIKYKDISGPDGVPDGKISPEYDKVLLGGSLPRYEYGGNIQLDYKNFDLNLIFQGVGKQNSYLSNTMVEPFRGGILAVPSFVEGNYWSKYNTAEQNRKVFYPRLSQVAAGAQNRNNGNNYVTSDYWLFDGSYFRMKNIIIGYSFPTKLTDQLNIKKVRVYGNLSNLFSIDHFPQGWDPEGSVTGYFMIRSFLLGVSVTF
jgi:TonB-linked SusC/RagA family outer membrane protein